MRILFIGRGADHASTRIRLLQYEKPLTALGFEVRTLEWRPNTTGQMALVSTRALRLARWADAIMILKPRLHPVVLTTIQRVNPRIVVDIDDAMWTWGGVFADRFDHAARAARAITAGNGHLTELAAQRYPHATCVRIPSAVDLDDYPIRPPHDDRRPVVVGWIGNTASLTDFSDPIAAALERHVDAGDIRLKIVSSRPLEHPGLHADFEPWSLATELDSLHSFDIGIMPLRDDEQSWGRCGLKAIQSMAVGTPVVASPIGAAPEIIDGHSNGLFASTEEEWFEAIAVLARSAALRASMGERARATVVAGFSVAANTAGLAEVFEETR